MKERTCRGVAKKGVTEEGEMDRDNWRILVHDASP